MERNLQKISLNFLHITLLLQTPIISATSQAIRTLDDPYFKKFLNIPDNPYPLQATTFLPPKRYAYYGEACENSDDCAPHLGLMCEDSSCTCTTPDFIARLNPDKSIDNHARTECVLRAGSKCGLKSFTEILHRDDLPRHKVFSTFLWNKIRKNIPFLIDGVSEHLGDSNCVDNANCIGGTCRCATDFFRDIRGLCLNKRTLFQPCEEGDEDQCRSSEGLQCYQGKCQCKRSMIFDKAARKCFIPIGAVCDAYSSNPQEYDMDCVRNAECSNERCICLDGYTRSSDGTCGVSHGNLCDSHERVCSDIQLTCRSGRCQCRYPVHQIFNETIDECLSKPDGPCTPHGRDSLEQNCVPNAECFKITGEAASTKKSMFDYICKCILGYAEDSSGACVPSYASPCVEDNDCDEVGQLSCVNAKCLCPDGMLSFDETRRKCVGLPGSRCKLIQLERILSMRIDIPTECVEGAVCMEHVSKLDGRCECKGGHKFSPTYFKCVPLARAN